MAYPLMEKDDYAAGDAAGDDSGNRISQAKDYRFCSSVYVWLRQEKSVMEIFKWFDSYVPSHYTATGIVDLLPMNHITWSEDGTGISYAPKSATG